METVRIRQRLTVIALLLLFPFFFWGGVNGNGGRIEKAVWDMGHFGFFAALAYLLETFFLLKIKNLTFRFILIMTVVVGCAAGVESLQLLLPGRYASLGDICTGLAGGLSVLCLLNCFKVRLMPRLILLGIAATTFVLSSAPLLLAVYDECSARRSFPLLSGFESFQEISRWGDCRAIKRVSKPVKTGQYAMRVTLPPGKYPGVTLRYFPQDWSGARAFRFAVYSPDSGTMLHFRVNDAWHELGEQAYTDRFHGSQLLDRGWNTIEIDMRSIREAPSTRLMDLSRVVNFRIFLVDNDLERYLYVDDVQLIVDE